jgi:glycosyltransferase involved in cell wall biosynthesis
MLISLVIAAYNVSPFIKKCILSCCQENLTGNYEIIVINDGSIDDTGEICDELAKSIPNLRIIHKENQGLGAARNTGIENAIGKYIWMIDGDDYISENVLPDLMYELEQNNIDVFALNYRVIDKHGKVLWKKYDDAPFKGIITGTNYYAIHFEYSYSCQYIFKKDIFAFYGIFFEERINMQDSEIMPKLMYHTNTMKFIPVIAYNYVQHENSFTNSTNPEKRYKYFQSIIKVRDSLVDFGGIIKSDNSDLYQAILKKKSLLHIIVFNHLVYYKYSDIWLKNILELLKQNEFYPLKATVRGKLVLVKWAMNISPFFYKKNNR